MNCSKCGAPLLNDAKFCTSCGTPINEVNNIESVNSTVANQPVEAPVEQPIQIQEPAPAVQAPVEQPIQIQEPAPVEAPAEQPIQIQEPAPAVQAPVEQSTPAKAASSSDTRIYKILSYIGILFLVGMLSKDKDDKSVRFHVGQGIMVFVVEAVIETFNRIVIFNIFKEQVKVFGLSTGEYTVSGVGIFISWVLRVAVFVIALIGIMNAANEKDKELPIIGKFAFYK